MGDLTAETTGLAEKLATRCMFEPACSKALEDILSRISSGAYPNADTSFQDLIGEIVGVERGALDETAACAIFHEAQRLFMGSMHAFFIPEEQLPGKPQPVLRTCPGEGPRTPNKADSPPNAHPNCELWAQHLAASILSDSNARDWFLKSFDELAAVQERFVAKMQELLEPVLPAGYRLKIVDATNIYKSLQAGYSSQRFVYFVPDSDAALDHGYHNLRGVPVDQLADP